ncbi:uncharacterized protein LOC143215145 [Lasioglossum baleicum]|uniref:uncharacterized protein LOC143215145 n=1 Tax=Lasioglossum baleicum TaxID=434251 RepID=UPI003FCD9A87
MDNAKKDNAVKDNAKKGNAELATDADLDNVRELVKFQQQEYYELLPDWTKYNKDEYEYLKQNIGFSIYGPPKQSTTSNESERQMVQYRESFNDDSHYVTDVVCYEPKAKAVIDKIFQKIYEFGHGSIDADSIHYGIIFNTMIPIKSKSLKKEEICVMTTPVFKIRKLKSGSSETSASTSKVKPISYEIWYIDMGGRVYKTWSDYKDNNTLPKYKMFLPKDGFYQPDRSYEITENSSRVWLEEADTPACQTVETVLRGIDIAANITGIGGLALGIASLFTPAAPVVIGAAAAAGGTALWGSGRSVQQLRDRSVHEESINPLADRHAFSSWLSITGSVVGLAASGGSVLLTQAIRNGSTISTATKVAYNSLTIGNLSINGVGVAYQAYCIYEEYREEGRVSYMSLGNLAAHLLFFGNAVINLQLAGNLIESTQGQYLDEYRNAIRSKRLRKQFNRARRIAAENNVGQMHENAEVIRFINRKYEVWQQNNIQVPNYNIVKFEKGVMKIDDKVLIDPMTFVSILLKADQCRNETASSEDVNSFMVCALRNLLMNLLESFNTSNSGRYSPVSDIDGFEHIFMELNNIENALDIFPVLFKTAIILCKGCRSPSDCLVAAVHFIWNYAKENLMRGCLDLTNLIENPAAQAALQEFIICMFEHADNVVKPLIPAFVRYLSGSG